MEHFERTVRVSRPEAGLEGYIVIHSTKLGPAAGGCRVWSYADDAACLEDASRLARGMSYKNAMAGLPLGGGKAVLKRPEQSFDRVRFFRAFGEEVDRLGGQYLTAEDVGTCVDDMEIVNRATDHVAGLPVHGDGVGGDPSPFTARGVFEAMRVAARFHLGRELDGVSVAVQGLGNVGRTLCDLLHEAGARLTVADINAKHVAWAERFRGAQAVDVGEILSAPVDILAPCALGAVLNAKTIPDVRASIVCGAANNQLATEEDGDRLARRGIVYVPDYVANAGGIVNVAGEHLGWDQDDVNRRVVAIGERVGAILETARAMGQPTHQVADSMARRLIAEKASAA